MVPVAVTGEQTPSNCVRGQRCCSQASGCLDISRNIPVFMRADAVVAQDFSGALSVFAMGHARSGRSRASARPSRSRLRFHRYIETVLTEESGAHAAATEGYQKGQRKKAWSS